MNKKKLWRAFRILLGGYIIGGVVLYFLQDLIIFNPKKLPLNHSFNFNQQFNEINISPDGQRNMNIVQFLPEKKAKCIVLYFHCKIKNI